LRASQPRARAWMSVAALASASSVDVERAAFNQNRLVVMNYFSGCDARWRNWDTVGQRHGHQAR